ncbi:MAG: transporter [Sideroxydans sp.]
MKNRFARCLSFSLLLLAAPTLFAEPIVADRPGFTTGTHTVSPGHFNIELGLQAEAGSRTVPLSNVRIGLTPVAEFDLQWSGWNFANGSTTVGDLTLGGKYRLHDAGDLKLSLLGLLTLPSGNGHPAGSRAAPLAALLWNHQTTGLFGMFQFASSNPGSLQTQWQTAIGASFSHNAQLGSYLELYNDHPLNQAGNDSFMVDGGFAWLLDERTQLDLHLDLDLNGTAADFIGVGFARSY